MCVNFSVLYAAFRPSWTRQQGLGLAHVREIEIRSRYGLQGENKNIALYVYINYCIVIYCIVLPNSLLYLVKPTRWAMVVLVVVYCRVKQENPG